jgi:hypothetical protein
MFCTWRIELSCICIKTTLLVNYMLPILAISALATPQFNFFLRHWLLAWVQIRCESILLDLSPPRQRHDAHLPPIANKSLKEHRWCLLPLSNTLCIPLYKSWQEREEIFLSFYDSRHIYIFFSCALREFPLLIFFFNTYLILKRQNFLPS